MNNKGFTLIELLATLLIIGVVMGITIPNITGIFNQGKITTYAEDAKKLRTSAEYLFRGDTSVVRPVAEGDCIAISLKYLDNSEFKPPYGGIYLETKSFVIIKKHNKRYYYYVQLIEKLPESGYRGFRLVETTNLEGDEYFNRIGEFANEDGFVDLKDYITTPNTLKNHSNVSGASCNVVLKVYTPD